MSPFENYISFNEATSLKQIIHDTATGRSRWAYQSRRSSCNKVQNVTCEVSDSTLQLTFKFLFKITEFQCSTKKEYAQLSGKKKKLLIYMRSGFLHTIQSKQHNTTYCRSTYETWPSFNRVSIFPGVLNSV